MHDLAVISERNRRAVIREWCEALASGDTARAERIRAANPDIFETDDGYRVGAVLHPHSARRV